MCNILAMKDGQIARPLKVLVQLIQKDIEEGNHAAETASMPYYQAAGAKLLEARGRFKRGEWDSWVKRNFTISTRQATLYMSYAKDDIYRILHAPH
jgi:hypothetical protein